MACALEVDSTSNDVFDLYFFGNGEVGMFGTVTGIPWQDQDRQTSGRVQDSSTYYWNQELRQAMVNAVNTWTTAIATPYDYEKHSRKLRIGFFLDYGIHGGAGFTTLSLYDQLYIAQHNIIRDLADQESCVIVGRCADYVLEDREDTLHVLIYADDDYRAERIVRLYGERDLPIAKRMKKKDSQRESYYRHYTNREWGDYKNYAVCLNTAQVDEDTCVELIVNLFNK
jgi:hypothetical protein